MAVSCSSAASLGGATGWDWGWWDTGIRTDNCAITGMVCNTTQDLHIGILNGGMALSTYMFNNTMQGYHHRGLIQNLGLLGQQGSPTAPTDMQWVGTFQESHTQRIYDANDPNPPTSLPFYRQDVLVGDPLNPANFVAVASPNDYPNLRINLTQANTGAESPYGCPVDWRNAAALVDVVNDSITWHGPDSIEQRSLARLEVYRAVSSDSALQANAPLLAFKDTFANTDLGQLDAMQAYLTPGLPDSVAYAYASKTASIVATNDIAALWRKGLILAFSKWADSDSTTVFNSSDSTLLKDIAQLCPYTSGPAVSLARTLLFSPTKEYFSLMHQCEMPEFTPPAERHGQEPQIDAPVTVILYPNPTTNRVTVEFRNGKPGSNCSLSISSADGKQVFHKRIAKPRSDLDLGLLPGMYLYEVKCDDGLIDNGKLVIISK